MSIKCCFTRATLLGIALILSTGAARAGNIVTLNDPQGDTGATTPNSGDAIDVQSLAVDLSGGVLTFTLSFYDPVSLAYDFNDNSVFGQVGIDFDGNTSTGTTQVPGLNDLGVDFIIDLSSEFDNDQQGLVDFLYVTSSGSTLVKTTAVSLSGDFKSISVSLNLTDFTNLVPTFDPETALYGAGIQNHGGDLTDVVKSSRAPVPEPSTLATAGASILCLLGYGGWRRRHRRAA